MTTMLTPVGELDTDTIEQVDDPWVVLLHNDPVNSMAFVSRALRTVFGYTEEKAAQLMLQAHTDGKTAVWSGERDKAEAFALQLHGYGLWATLAQDR